MNADTPITRAAARCGSRDVRVAGFDMVWEARTGVELDHTAVAVLTKDDSGTLKVEGLDATAKLPAWVGAAVVVVAPGVGVQTTWGDLAAELDSEVAKALESSSS